MTKAESLLRSRFAIERLIYDYGEYLDGGDLEGVARLFTHGRMTGPDGSALAEGYEGMLALYRRIIRVYPPANTPRTQHVFSNLVLDIDEENDRAKGTCCYTVFQQAQEAPLEPIIAGRYRDTFRRIDADWHFDNRQTLPLLFGDLSRHLAGTD